MSFSSSHIERGVTEINFQCVIKLIERLAVTAEHYKRVGAVFSELDVTWRESDGGIEISNGLLRLTIGAQQHAAVLVGVSKFRLQHNCLIEVAECFFTIVLLDVSDRPTIIELGRVGTLCDCLSVGLYRALDLPKARKCARQIHQDGWVMREELLRATKILNRLIVLSFGNPNERAIDIRVRKLREQDN